MDVFCQKSGAARGRRCPYEWDSRKQALGDGGELGSAVETVTGQKNDASLSWIPKHRREHYRQLKSEKGEADNTTLHWRTGVITAAYLIRTLSPLAGTRGVLDCRMGGYVQ